MNKEGGEGREVWDEGGKVDSDQIVEGGLVNHFKDFGL